MITFFKLICFDSFCFSFFFHFNHMPYLGALFLFVAIRFL
ncbi:putative membrane protein [Escherichia coli 3-267-03_S1_C1]|nr:putative membrane protein [Escherichia coli 3-267-03_S1_C3]KDU21110.1 putative membrane protein [Escherichia coli 3-267-03_S1_C1]